MRSVKKGESKLKKIGIFILLLLLFLVLLNSVRKVYKKKEGAEKALVRMQEEIKTLEDRKQYLATSIERLKTKDGIDFEIRKKLNVAATGESVAIIVDEASTTSDDSTSLTTWQKIKSLWDDLWH